MVVGERQPVPQRRPLGPARGHDDHADERHQQEERAVARAPRPDEPAQDERRDQQADDHDGLAEQQHVPVPRERVEPPPEPHADVARPEAQQPQRLADRRRPPDRPRLLGERQEVRPVAGMDDHRDDPPGARHEQGDRHAQPIRNERAHRHAAPAQVVEDQQERPDEDPAGDRHVHPAARRRQHQRERRGPAPRLRVAQPAVHAEQQPRQRRVGQERHRRAVRVDRHVRVHDEQHRRGDVR